MDTLTAYLSSGHITRALEHERLAAVQRTWRESFGHPAHRDMLADHNERVREFYGRGDPGTQPGTPKQINELVDAVTGYHPTKKYTRKAS